MKKTKIAITGSGGFLGQRLVSALQDQELLLLKHPIDLEKVKEFSPEIIYNLQAYGNMANQKDDKETLNANIVGTFNLLEATKNIPYRAFIQVSTSSVLLDHQTIYSATKLGAEALCKAYIDEYEKPIIVARPFSVYGDGEAEFRFIPTVIKALLYGEMIDLDVDATHDWVYVKDFINALINLTPPGFINLGTGYSFSNLEIVRKLEKISGKQLNYTEKKMRSFDNKNWVSPEASVTSDIDLGLVRTFEYYVKRFTAN